MNTHQQQIESTLLRYTHRKKLDNGCTGTPIANSYKPNYKSRRSSVFSYSKKPNPSRKTVPLKNKTKKFLLNANSKESFFTFFFSTQREANEDKMTQREQGDKKKLGKLLQPIQSIKAYKAVCT